MFHMLAFCELLHIGHYACGAIAEKRHLHEPFAELVRLSRASVADDMAEEGVRGVPHSLVARRGLWIDHAKPPSSRPMRRSDLTRRGRPWAVSVAQLKLGRTPERCS